MAFGALALLLIIIAIGGYLAYRYPVKTTWREHADLPVCGRCGYPSRGIESLTCPECGTDLREVGILPSGVHKTGRAGWAVVWTVGLFVASIILVSLAAPIVNPWTVTAREVRQFHATGGQQPGATVITQVHDHLYPPWRRGDNVTVEVPVHVMVRPNVGRSAELHLTPTVAGWLLHTNATPIQGASDLARALAQSAGGSHHEWAETAQAISSELSSMGRLSYVISRFGSRQLTNSSITTRPGQGSVSVNIQRSTVTQRGEAGTLVSAIFFFLVWLWGLRRLYRGKGKPEPHAH